MNKIKKIIKDSKGSLIGLFAPLIAISIVVLAAKIVNSPEIIKSIKDNGQVFIAIISSALGLFIVIIVPNFLKSNGGDKSDQVLQRKYLQINHTNTVNRKLPARRARKQTKRDPYVSLTNTLSPLEDNIKSHIVRLQNNSMLNLIIGILGTLVSITVLSTILLSEHKVENSQAFLLYFIPRLSFTILIQLFAFFFLRLYKNNLEDSKYFQNELTNVIAKTTAIKIAFQEGDKSLLADITKELSKVERNFKLAAGETLLNLEKAKIEKDIDREMLSLTKDFFNGFKSKSE